MDAAVRGEATPCFHCGDPVAAGVAVHEPLEDAARAFCCGGCAAAARWIRDARLGDYYRLRDAAGSRVDATLVDYAAWDREDVIAGHVHPCAGGREIVLLTDGMHCAACAWLIDRALRCEPGVLDAGANAMTGRVRIAWDPARAPLSRVLARMAALGYRPYLAAGDARERERQRERNRWLLRIGIAGLGAMQAMMFAEALYLDTAHAMPGATRDFFRWLALLVSAPVVFYSGWPFLAGMARELRARRAGMDTLVSLSVLVAFLASVVQTLRGGEHVWYDAAVMFVFLLLCARMLEQRVRRLATAQVDALARARPALAVREAAGVAEQVPVAHLVAGDVVRVAPGETVPADAVLLDAEGAFDEALLSGESTPLHRVAGDAVYAGSLC
ncbi:MAG TPA: heavy metal translocating P-type ATPase metal-binding domain-containing protein, partial [Xanthomonadaceae bacterium]|nr:heavy metal translocating P-type ATPase metal-binding domain-containing protein [Xanthomonadaceae bacterium]